MRAARVEWLAPSHKGAQGGEGESESGEGGCKGHPQHAWASSARSQVDMAKKSMPAPLKALAVKGVRGVCWAEALRDDLAEDDLEGNPMMLRVRASRRCPPR